MAGCPWFGPWIHLISGPSASALDPGSLIPDRAGDKAQYLGIIIIYINLHNRHFFNDLINNNNNNNRNRVLGN